jgi:flagellar export protein FliJ
MPKFRFRLENILKLRKTREDEALRSLGAAQRAYQACVAAKAKLLGELEAALLRREGLGASAIGILAFQVEQSFIDGTKQRIARSDHAILRAGKAVEKALRAYLAARKQSRMLETLREKDYREFRRVVAKREAKAQDDFTVMRYRLKAEESA